MSHLDDSHRFLFSALLRLFTFFSVLITALVAVTRTARTNLLATHGWSQLTSEQLSLLIALNLETLLGFLLGVGAITSLLYGAVHLHQYRHSHHTGHIA